MIYGKTLDNVNQITVGTYYKNPAIQSKPMGVYMPNIVVQSLDGDNATICNGDNEICTTIIAKTSLLELINSFDGYGTQ